MTMPLHSSRQLERRILQVLEDHPEGLLARDIAAILGEPVPAGSMNYLRNIGRIRSLEKLPHHEHVWGLNA